MPTKPSAKSLQHESNRKEFIRLCEKIGRLTKVCEAFGCDFSTYYKYRRDINPEWGVEVDAALLVKDEQHKAYLLELQDKSDKQLETLMDSKEVDEKGYPLVSPGVKVNINKRLQERREGIQKIEVNQTTNTAPPVNLTFKPAEFPEEMKKMQNKEKD